MENNIENNIETNESNKYIFLVALRDRWIEGGLSANEPDEPVTIRMGRSIVFRGEIGQAPAIDKLSPSNMAMIMSALDLSDTDIAKELRLEPSTDAKGTINIERAGEQIFRYSKGQIEIDVFKPERSTERVEAVEATAALEAFGVSAAEVATAASVESVEPPVFDVAPETQVEAVAVETATVQATSEGQQQALESFGFDSVGDVVDEVVFNELSTEKFYSELTVEAVVVEPTQPQQPAWMQDNAQERLEALRQNAKPEPAPVEQAQPAAPEPDLKQFGVEAAQLMQKGVSHVVSEATTKVPAMAIAMLELHDQLKEPARNWLRDRFQEVADAGIGEDLKTKGAAALRDGLKAMQQLPRQTRERAVCDSVMTLVQAFGVVEPNGKSGQAEAVYKTEDYTIRLQASEDGKKGLRLQDVGKMNTYVVEDSKGKELLSFQHNGIRGTKITQNKLPLNQQYDFVRAGSQVIADKTVTVAKNTADRLQKMATGLANLAPAGTKEKLQAFQHQQVAAIAQTLVNSKAAVESTAGKTFRGDNYQFFESLGVTRIFAKGGRGEVFRKDKDGIQSRLTDKDLTDLTASGKTLAKTQTAQAKAGKAAAGR